MASANNSHSTDSTSSGNHENTAIYQIGIELERLYSLDVACEVLRLSKANMLEIRRKYINQGIIRMGNSYACLGRDLFKILTAESELHG